MNLRGVKKQEEGACISMEDTQIEKSARAKADVSVKLAEIWKKLLGVESVGADDDYFMLGGDSILAVQLFCEIETVFGVKLPVASLFDTPTVASLARVIEREAPASWWSSLVPIQTAGTRPPFFCMHAHGGNVLNYRDLSRHLGSDQPFYGLQSQGLDGESRALETIEEMAAQYVMEIRGVQPNGPYFLGGYCMGGTIAYEVAQQLDRRGERVAVLALFDVVNTSKLKPRSVSEQARYNIERIAFHVSNLISLSHSDRSRFLAEKFRSVRLRMPVWSSLIASKLGRTPPPSSNSAALAQVWRANSQAASNYVPQPYSGSLFDFRPSKQYKELNGPELKWAELSLAGSEVVILPVNPPGMLIEPFVTHLADALRSAIDGALRDCERIACSRVTRRS